MPDTKIEFLVALHTLLIGQAQPDGTRVLPGLEQTLLQSAINAAYRRCSTTGERPCEQVLHDELRARARAQDADRDDGDPSLASDLRRLTEQLCP